LSFVATAFTKTNIAVNKLVKPWLESPRFGRLISARMALISYEGRRSGKTFSLPVAYSRKGDEVSINVAVPDHKSWWRNFEGAGGPLRLQLKGAPHEGHATASKDAKGRVSVKVALTS
jgi:hypothetical protein